MKSSQILREKEFAVSNLIAREADKDSQVVKFREEIMGGKFKELGEIAAWAQDQQNRDLEAFRSMRGPNQSSDLKTIAERLGVSVRALERIIQLIEPYNLTLDQFAQRILRIQSPLADSIADGITSHRVTSPIEGATLYLSLPDVTAKKSALLHTVKGGTLERLRTIASDLAKRFGWSETEATIFVLTGKSPRIRLIDMAVSPTKITMEIDLSVDAETVANKYREIRKHYKLSHTRDSGKKMRLAEFVFARGHWGLSTQELFNKWNQVNRDKSDWQYEDLKTFGRDVARLEEKFVVRDHIDPIVLMDENPYFTRVRTPQKPSEKTVTLQALVREGVSRATIWRLVDRGVLPKPKRIGGKSRWPESVARTAIQVWKRRKNSGIVNASN